MNQKIKQKVCKNLVLVLMSALFLSSTQIACAQTGTANNSESASESATEEQKNEDSTLDNIKKVIQEKKTELGTASSDLRSKKAYLAKVLRVSEETITVNNYSGNKIIPLENTVLIQNEKGKDIKVSEIAVEDWIGVYGETINDNLKITKKVLYETDFSPKDKAITLGSISTIGKSDLKIMPRSGDEELNFSFGKTTDFQNYQGEEAGQTDFYEDLQCLVIAFADKNGNYVVSTIRALSTFEK
jgi:hypothetical protein